MHTCWPYLQMACIDCTLAQQNMEHDILLMANAVTLHCFKLTMLVMLIEEFPF